MVNALFIVGVLMSAPPSLAHVRVARGHAIIDGLDAQKVSPGRALPAGAVVETAEDGFVEIGLGPNVRVRISAATRATIGEDTIALDIGRLWVQATRPVSIALPDANIRIDAKTSVITEHTNSGGSVLAVRAGSAEVAGSSETVVRLKKGEIIFLRPGASDPSPPKPGGAGLGELTVAETLARTGDLIGLRALLLSRTESAAIAAARLRGVEAILRGDAELSGAEAAALLEAAIRPPAFFDEEVPPKGPNVRVEVTFGE